MALISAVVLGAAISACVVDRYSPEATRTCFDRHGWWMRDAAVGKIPKDKWFGVGRGARLYAYITFLPRDERSEEFLEASGLEHERQGNVGITWFAPSKPTAAHKKRVRGCLA